MRTGDSGPTTDKLRKALRALDYIAPQIIGSDNKINGQGISGSSVRFFVVFLIDNLFML